MGKTDWHPSPGHIVFASVPYADVEGSKSRFAVVVSSAVFNSAYPEVVVAFATRSLNVRHHRPYDVCVSDRHPEFAQTGLAESTTVRCGRLWTLNQRAIAHVVGVMPSDLLIDVERLVRQCF
jgi:mRNA-degrading endonuclease toxin of MazEF toxin-antitoxin module